MRGMKRFRIFRDGKVHVMGHRCDTCIFRPGNLMRLEKGRVAEMVKAATCEESSIVCHETLGSRRHAVCHGFFQKHKTGPLQIAERLGFIQWQKPFPPEP